MAKFNPIKVKQDADKNEKAGRLDQAIALYRQLVDDNPRDWNTINKIGDIYARMNRNREASQEYAKVADFYARDGFLLKAIAIWKKINKLDPSVLEPYLNLADLYAKQGLMMEAKSQYQIVVDEYVKRGRSRDAADVLKKMVEIDPGDLKIRSKLADLFTREGNTSKAVEEYVAIADELNKKGHLAEALQVLEKGLKLDPKSNRLREELARVHLIQKNYEKAAHYLEEAVRNAPNDPRILGRLGEAYLGGHKIEEAEAIFKRLLEINPADEDSRVQMGRVFLMQGQLDRAFDELVPVVDKLLERREGDRAAALLQQLVQKNPSHVRSLVKLVEIHRILQNDRSVVSTYQQLSEAYLAQGQLEQAASVLEILIGMEPQNQQYKSKLQFVQKKLPASARAASAGLEMDEDFEFSLGGPELTPIEEPSPRRGALGGDDGSAAGPLKAPVIELSGPLGEEDQEFIDEHLAEGKVFRKYGLVDKAVDQFESVIARFPDNDDARLELAEIYEEKDQPVRAAEQFLAVAEIFRLRGEGEKAEAQIERARSLAPDAVAGVAAAAGGREEVSAATAAAEGPLDFPDLLPEEGPTVQEPAGAGVEEEEISLGPGEEIPLELEDEAAPQQEEFEIPEEEIAGPPVETAGPDEFPFLGEEAEIGADLGSGLAEELSLGEPELPPPPAPLRAAPRPASTPAAAALPADLQRVLDEVDSYISLGFVDDAKDALREVAARHPDHPAILQKMEELGIESLEEAAPAPPEAPAEAPSLDDAFADLGLPEPPPVSFEPPAPVDENPLSEVGLGGEEFPEPGFEEPPEFSPPAGLPEVAEESPLADALVGGAPEPAPPIPSAPAAPSPPEAAPWGGAEAAPGGFDLGAELDDLFAPQAAVEEPPAPLEGTDLGDTGLAEIFKEFKKGVDRQLGQEDFDTRYNLGIAYKEMGLVDEAIAEFQLAAKDESRLLECASMLGICFMEKGMPKLAVKWFEKGLGARGRTEEEYLGLRYDLAAALEAAGEAQQALGVFSELYGQDANFRDVATKVRDLKAALG